MSEKDYKNKGKWIEPWKREVPEFGATSSRGHDDVEAEPVEMEPRRRNRWNWEEEGDDGTRRHGTAERS